MRVILTGGGTAGHVNPAIAIAEIIKENDKNAEIIFVGTPDGIENKLTAAAGFPIRHTKSKGFDRSLSIKNFYALWLALYSPIKARRIVKDFKPDVIIGTGGHVCWPIMKAGSDLGVKTVLHESNAVPGAAVKMLEGRVDKILLNFEESAAHLKKPEKSVVVGNPLRRGFRLGNREKARKELGIAEDERLILSFGGSLGALEVNNSCIEMMASYVEKNEKIFHIHASGVRNYKECKEKFDSLLKSPSNRVRLLEYIDDMPSFMSAADVVISRAGAMSLSEIALMEKASVLIPSPNVTNGHQLKNAKALADKNATVLLEEKNLSCEALTLAVKGIFENEEKKRELEKNVSAFAFRDANRRVYEEIASLIKK